MKEEAEARVGAVTIDHTSTAVTHLSRCIAHAFCQQAPMHEAAFWSILQQLNHLALMFVK